MSTGNLRRLLVCGALPSAHAGNSVSTQVLVEALQMTSDVTMLTHHASFLPLRSELANDGSLRQLVLGTQPFAVHGEGLLAGRLHRQVLRRWPAGWAVNSRYASALFAAGIPYVIWEATTIREELFASTLDEIRRSGRGSGLGRTFHVVTLPLGERLESLLYRGAYRVLTMSQHTRHRITTRYSLSGDHVRLLTHPPTRSFLHTLSSRSAGTQLNATSQAPSRLLFVGRVDDPRKNFDLLLSATRRLIDAGHACTLTIIGPYNEKWKRRLRLGGLAEAVSFAGPVSLEALVDAYLTHDLLVVPSRQEGFGIVVAEAFSAGLPVVATRCGGPEDIVQRSEAGLLVEHSVEALADAIVVTLKERHRLHRMRENARAFARRELSFDHFAAQVREITCELLEAQHR